MPKKPHPPRNNGPSKKTSLTAGGSGSKGNNNDESSFIVFTNDTKSDSGKKKSGQARTANGSSASTSLKSNTIAKNDAKNEQQPDGAPKRPDVRTLIGGASWTGKLPVNMLSEHCQKQKWERPDYSMHKLSDGQFSSMVTLSQKDPKSQEVVKLPSFVLPPEQKHLAVQPTAAEAKHFAAAYSLFRIASGKNIHMMMPPVYRDLWRGAFQEMKDADVKDGKAWMYAPDPFLARKERDETREKNAKAREQREKQLAAEASKPGAVKHLSSGIHDHPRQGQRWWNNAPKVEMGKRLRRDVESIVRDLGRWNVHDARVSRDACTTILRDLLQLGFRKSHIEEAINICKDKEEILEWLLIHVPEDDLPSWSLPEGYTAGVSMASGNLKREAVIKRLASGGYASELCEEMYDSAGGDEAVAAENLQNMLLQIIPAQNLPQEEQLVDNWSEEKEVLKAIYERRFKYTGQNSFQVTLETSSSIGQITLTFQKPSGPYPDILPVMVVSSAIPAYIRLSLTKRALEHASKNFLGDQMIFNIVDWLEHNVQHLVDDPGRLADVSSAVVPSSSFDNGLSSPKESKKRKSPNPIMWQSGSNISLALLAAWETKQSDPMQQKMLKARQNLPAWKLQEAIVSAVNSYQIVIISGETGSGKSTQSVQFILDDLIKKELGECVNIICTQPRRISALGLADRVADERCSKVGQEIGYAIRGESKQSRGSTKITFVTTGVLLRRLQTSGGSLEDMIASLADVSHIVIDEVHERSLDTDFLLALLRDVLKQRHDLKVILMSATLDAEAFQEYFGGPKFVARIEIQGRTHPVEDIYLDEIVRIAGLSEQDPDEKLKNIGGTLRKLGMGINYDLITRLIQEIDKDLGAQEGGILIFLPGAVEINRTLEALRSMPQFHALPLHASLLPSEQRRIFPPPPRGKRKVIASTNIAETSITIEDIVAVIDTGRVKETHFDPETNMVKLEEVWASRAACKQRRGRAGRVRAGKCFKMYTQNAESKMQERPDPEICRVPLEQLCLSVKAMGISNVSQFLGGTLTPPASLAIEGAMDILRQVGALNVDGLTALGQHMAMIPADLRCAKLMVYGALLDCLEAAVTIAAILTVKSPFISPPDKRDASKAARITFSHGQGDVVADLRAYDSWSAMRNSHRQREIRGWCEENFLSYQTLMDISTTRIQYMASLQEIRFLDPNYRSPSSDGNRKHSYPLLHALLLSALHPQTLMIQLPSQKYQSTSTGTMALNPESRAIKYFSTSERVSQRINGTDVTIQESPGMRTRMFIHPSSTLFSAQSFPNNAAFLSYFVKVETSKVFIRECTPCGTFGMLLLGGGQIELDTRGRGISLTNSPSTTTSSTESSAHDLSTGAVGHEMGRAIVRVPFRGWARIGVLISRLRTVVDDILSRWIESPGHAPSDSERRVLSIVRRLVELEGMDQ